VCSLTHSLLLVLLIFSFFFLIIRRPPRSTLFPSRRSSDLRKTRSPSSTRPRSPCSACVASRKQDDTPVLLNVAAIFCAIGAFLRSEEHTSELQSRGHLVCRLLLEKKNNEK